MARAGDPTATGSDLAIPAVALNSQHRPYRAGTSHGVPRHGLGMFMAILDIQIVSASLTEYRLVWRRAAMKLAWVQTAYLIAEVVMIPLSGFLSRALGRGSSFLVSAAGFNAASLMWRAVDLDQRDDPMAAGTGLHWRSHDPDRFATSF